MVKLINYNIFTRFLFRFIILSYIIIYYVLGLTFPLYYDIIVALFSPVSPIELLLISYMGIGFNIALNKFDDIKKYII